MEATSDMCWITIYTSKEKGKKLIADLIIGGHDKGFWLQLIGGLRGSTGGRSLSIQVSTTMQCLTSPSARRIGQTDQRMHTAPA